MQRVKPADRMKAITYYICFRANVVNFLYDQEAFMYTRESGKMSIHHVLLLTLAALFGLSVKGAAVPVYAQDMIVADTAGTDESFDLEAMTETEPLLETEAVYEVPAGLADALKKDTPVGDAAQMTSEERSAWIRKIYEANSAEDLWNRHDDVLTTFRLFDEESQMWKEYCCSYTDKELRYYDDWTPGFEELRLLIRGENDCVEDYTISKRFVRFLNASGQPYRSLLSDPVILDEDTLDETLLMIQQSEDTLVVVTQLTEPTIFRLGLEDGSDYDDSDDDPDTGSFYSCTYLLDSETLDVHMMQISRHTPEGTADSAPGPAADNTANGSANSETGGMADDKAGSAPENISYTVTDLRNISCSYDHGMTPFVETGLTGLYRHLEPGKVWEEDDLRTVTVTLDPGTAAEQEFSLTALKGDPVSFSLPDGYELYSDETLTTRWVDNGDYTADLTLWAAALS